MPETPRTRSNRACALLIFVLVAGVYGLTAGGHPTSNDEEAMLATAEALIDHGTPELTITDQNTIRVAARIPGRTGEPVSFASFSQSLIAVPAILAGRVVAAPLPERHEPFAERLVVFFTNGLITAAGVALFFLIAIEIGARRKWAVVLALVYAFATFAWPHSKTFFSEPATATLLLAGALFVLRTGPGAVRNPLAAGFLLGMVAFTRPPVAACALPMGLYVLYRTIAPERSVRGAVVPALSIALGVVPGLALLAWTNWWRFGDATELGYPGSVVKFNLPLHEGLYSLLLSPGKGLFWFAPPVIVGVAALVVAVRRSRWDIVMLGAVGVINVLMFSKYFQWHGDHAWGPRYVIMGMPFLILPAAPLLERVEWRRALRVAAAVGAFVAIIGVGVSFNNYFVWAGAPHRLNPQNTPEGPTYWGPLHYDARWSQITGHTILLPYAALNSARRIPGGGKELPPFPEGVDARYDWYLKVPAQLDFWEYWLIPTGAPKVLILLVLPFLAGVVVGGRGLVDELGITWRRRAAGVGDDDEAGGDRSGAPSGPSAKAADGHAPVTVAEGVR